MRKPIALVVLGLALAGCSGKDTSGEPRASSGTTTSTTATTTVVSTTVAVAANQTTTTACREFADNDAVDLVRDAIANGSTSVDTFDVSDAFIAVFELEVVAVRPGLDQGVAAAMNLASQQSQAQQSVWADTAELDPVSFDRMVTGVDVACESAGVDMT